MTLSWVYDSSNDYLVAAYVYSWEGSSEALARLSATNVLTPDFSVPEDVDADTEYRYVFRATNTINSSLHHRFDISVTVRDTDPSLACTHPDPAYEGSGEFTLDCSVTNEPSGATYSWEGTDVSDRLTNTDSVTPTFTPPDNVDADTQYEYTVTMSVGGSDVASAGVTVTVLDKEELSIVCTNYYDYFVDPDPVLAWYLWYVYEGDPDFEINCKASGLPASSVYTYVWTGTDIANLSATNIVSPMFSVPEEVDEEETHTYTLTVSADNAESASVNFTVIVQDRNPSLACTHPDPAYEGSGEFTLDCSVTNAPSDATYSWEGTDVANRLSGTDSITPTFTPPDNVDADTEYDYTVTMTSGGSVVAQDDVTVTVLERPDISCSTARITGITLRVYEGKPDIPLVFCSGGWRGAPSGSDYAYAWTTRGDTPDTALLSAADVASPNFLTPDEVDETTTYSYTLTVSAENADDASGQADIDVLEKPDITVTCEDIDDVDEGADNIKFDCSASEAPGDDPQYTWSWSPTDRLTDYDTGTPTFAVPDSVEQDTTYTYAVTATANKADAGTAEVQVTVRDTDAPVPSLAINCQIVGAPSNASNMGMTIAIWERMPDLHFACEVTDAPENAAYVWSWTASTGMTDLALLSDDDISNPVFDVPDIDGSERHEYIVTATSDVGETGEFPVEIQVAERYDILVTCTETAYDVPEGADTPDFAFDCRADGSLFPPYSWSWSPTDRLTDHDTGTPTFDVPDDPDRKTRKDTTYVYTATVTALYSDAGQATVEVTVRDTDTYPPETPGITCIDPDPVYEGAANFTLDCSPTNEPTGATYAWTARGSTVVPGRLSGTDGLAQTFSVPDDIDEPGGANKDYKYTVTLSADGINDITEDVTVTVLEKPDIQCYGEVVQFFREYGVAEGHGYLTLSTCGGDWQGAPTGSAYAYAWTVRGSRPETTLSLLDPTDAPETSFQVPAMVAQEEIYEYRFTVSARNADPAVIDYKIKVYDTIYSIDVACARHSVYEGSEDFALDCSASGAPSGSDYVYEWTARGSTVVPGQLSSTTVEKPTFHVPDDVPQTTTYEYRLTVSADNAEDGTTVVMVQVLNKKALDVACATPSPVYEGSEDFALDCAATGAPAGSDYTYVWTGRGSTVNTDLLISGTDGPAPTFDVPEEVDEDETYEYLLTVSAENAEDATAEVTVKVLNLGSIALVCASPPLVYEGSEDFALDCTISGDTGDNVDYAYEWTAIGATPNTSRLSAVDISSPTFYVPDALDETTTYEYLLTASAENAEDASAEVTVTVLNRGALALACADPGSVYEGSEDIAFDCSASGAPAGSAYEYAWTARGSTTNTALLSAADIPSPTFYVPEEVDATTTYEYLLTARAANAESASAEVTVTVLNRGALALACADPDSVYEGSEDFAFDCSASGAPAGSAYEYEWTGRGSTTDTALLSAADIASPTFYVPDEVAGDETYEYRLTVSAENADPASADVTVKVLNKGALSVACATPSPVYEGSEDFALDCAASGAPADSEYTYVWTGRGSTTDTALLSAADIASPTFYVPDEVAGDETYEYRLTVSAENADPASADVTVKVLNKGALSVACATPSPVYEGSEDFALDCAASGAPGGSTYEYEWTARNGTANTNLLIAGADGPAPTFDVPEEVDEDETYEYLLTVSAENAEDARAEVTVKVLNLGSIALVCASPPLVYEGSEDFALDCSVSGDTGDNVDYAYEWAAIGATPNTSRLSAVDISSPTFYVPDALDETTTYEYLLTARAENAESASAEVTVTVLNRGALAVVCTDPGSVYEGSADVALDCAASGAPAGSEYTYVWTGRGSTTDTALLSAADIASPTFYVPDALDETTTYEYLLTARAENAEDATAEVTVTVLNKGRLRLCARIPVLCTRDLRTSLWIARRPVLRQVPSTHTSGRDGGVRRIRRY